MKVENIISEIVNALEMTTEPIEVSSATSYYKEAEFGRGEIIIIRVSDHKTYLDTWAKNYPTKRGFPTKEEMVANGGKVPYKYRVKYMYSFVFEDEETEGNLVVTNGHPYSVLEFCFKAKKVTRSKLNEIIEALKNLLSTKVYDESVLGTPVKLIPFIKY